MRSSLSSIRRRAETAPAQPSFGASLRASDVRVIAEVKRSSPSKGAINPGIDVGRQAAAYEKGGAAAISILTEPTRFSGSNDDLLQARASAALPLLKKDFHVDPVQIFEAKALGASAALVIVRAVEPKLFRDLLDVGRDISLEILAEVRDEAELELALASGATLIGVNNRNLETLQIDAETAVRLIPLVPARAIAVAESGVKSAADVARFAAAGADAVLVGSEVSASKDPETAVRALTGIARSASARKG
jgi:indole-3-glycerol phosphate synthase